MRAKILFVLGLAMALGSAWADTDTWYVDDDNFDGAVRDGSPENPYGTIQEAIDAETTLEGHTILVLPGVYTNGVNNEFSYPCRVYVDKKKLTIRSTDGREKTHIVGYADPTGNHGIGPNAIACVVIAADYVIIDGFTIRDGHTLTTADGMGGGVYGKTSAHLIDCTVRDCASRNGPVSYINVHRCQIGPNNGWGSNSGGLFGAPAENSIIVGNLGNAVHYQALVNCTVVGNAGAASYSGDGASQVLYNSVIAMNTYDYDSSQSNCKFTNSVTTASADKFGHHSASVFDVPKTNLFVAPLFNDFRLKPGSAAIGVADPKWLKKVSLPEGYVYRDYLGQEINTNATAINAGAIQPVQPLAGGCLSVQGVAGILFDGRAVLHEKMDYASPTVWPTQWCVTAASPEKPLSCVADSAFDQHTFDVNGGMRGRRFAGYDGKVWISPPCLGTSKTIAAECAEVFRYADPKGSDSYDGTSPTNVAGTTIGPWKTLQHVADSTKNSKRTVVYCAPGSYDEGFGFGGGVFTNRVAMPATSSSRVHFVATEGPDKTFICGASHDPSQPDTPENNYGLGDKAMRCVFAGSSNDNTGFTGFTFTGGHNCNTVDAAGKDYRTLGALFYADGWCGFTDCVISNNVAQKYVVYGRSIYERCRFVCNRICTDSSIFYNVYLCGCVVDNNFAKKGACVFNSSSMCVNSTVLSGEGMPGSYATVASGSIVNTIISDFEDRFASKAGCEVRGCLFDDTTTSLSGLDYATGDPLYCDKASGDYGLMPGSAALGIAKADGEAFALMAGTDYTGKPIAQTGVPCAAGAFLGVLTNGVAIVAEEGGLAVAGGQIGNNRLEPGETISVTMDAASALRPIFGVEVNGVTNLFDETPSVSVGYDQVVAAQGVSIRALYSDTWYVNANVDPSAGTVGDDENSGFTPSTPKLSLAAVMSEPRLKAGAVVIAAPGVYSNGVMNTKGYLTRSRVEVPSGVTLRSAEGPERTFIVGARATEDFEESGCGTNAIRCVHLEASATLEGFTLTGGYSQRFAKSGSMCGAAAVSGSSYQSSNYSLVRDCIISNCCGYSDLVYTCRMVNSRVLENTCKDNGIARGCNLYGVLFARNYVRSVPLNYCTYVECVTWAPDNMFLNGTPFTWGVLQAGGAKYVYNSIICGNFQDANFYVSNSVVRTGCVPAGILSFGNSRELTDAEMALGPDYRPIPGVSQLTEKGSLDGCNTDLMGATDLSGNPRVMNGQVDPGALEADWRPRYAADIGGRRVRVVTVTPDVTETDDGAVSLGNGSLALTLNCAGRVGARCEIGVRVSGTGVLHVLRNGVALADLTNDEAVQTISFAAAADLEELVFAYDRGENDTGSAEIVSVGVKSGIILIVR